MKGTRTAMTASGPVTDARPSRAAIPMPNGSDGSDGSKDLALCRVASAAGLLALIALVVGGCAMALTARAGTSIADVLPAIDANPWPFVAGGVGLTLVSMFDIFTIPGLHAVLGRRGPVLIVVATATAVIGDLLGIVGRLAQTALVPLAMRASVSAEAPLLAAGQALDGLEATINTAGFVLVSVSFTCFGLLMLRGFSRPIGWIAVVAGISTLLGQIPALSPVFMVANLCYVGWYIGISRRFRTLACRSNQGARANVDAARNLTPCPPSPDDARRETSDVERHQTVWGDRHADVPDASRAGRDR